MKKKINITQHDIQKKNPHSSEHTKTLMFENYEGITHLLDPNNDTYNFWNNVSGYVLLSSYVVDEDQYGAFIAKNKLVNKSIKNWYSSLKRKERKALAQKMLIANTKMNTHDEAYIVLDLWDKEGKEIIGEIFYEAKGTEQICSYPFLELIDYYIYASKEYQKIK